MPLHDVLADMPALFFSSAVSAVVLGLMLFMSVRLYAGNRKRAYRTLLVSLGAMLAHHLVRLTMSASWLPDASVWTWVGKSLQTFAFVALNFALFELYFRRRPRTRLWFYGLTALGAFAAAGDLLSLIRAGEPGARALAGMSILDGLLLILPLLFALMFGPHIGQRRKYTAGLAAAFAAHACSASGRFAAPDAALILGNLAELLQVVYDLLLFMLLFERVVELLTAAYRSSVTDGLTNLYNRKYFTGQLDRALRSGKPVGVIFCDIDNFKRLNDTHGHHRADGVLKQVAAILAEETSGIGIAGRYGGEELVAFVTGPALSAVRAAETIRLRTEKETLVTLSVGIAVAPANAAVSAETLLKRADQAMYRSKTSGKNRVTDFAELAEGDAAPLPFKR